MPRIESISVCIARVPLDNVTPFATHTVSARDYGLVKVRSTDGVEGIGFCYVGSAGGCIAQVAVEEPLGPRLLGQESLRVEGAQFQTADRPPAPARERRSRPARGARTGI